MQIKTLYTGVVFLAFLTLAGCSPQTPPSLAILQIQTPLSPSDEVSGEIIATQATGVMARSSFDSDDESITLEVPANQPTELGASIHVIHNLSPCTPLTSEGSEEDVRSPNVEPIPPSDLALSGWRLFEGQSVIYPTPGENSLTDLDVRKGPHVTTIIKAGLERDGTLYELNKSFCFNTSLPQKDSDSNFGVRTHIPLEFPSGHNLVLSTPGLLDTEELTFPLETDALEASVLLNLGLAPSLSALASTQIVTESLSVDLKEHLDFSAGFELECGRAGSGSSEWGSCVIELADVEEFPLEIAVRYAIIPTAPGVTFSILRPGPPEPTLELGPPGLAMLTMNTELLTHDQLLTEGLTLNLVAAQIATDLRFIEVEPATEIETSFLDCSPSDEHRLSCTYDSPDGPPTDGFLNTAVTYLNDGVLRHTHERFRVIGSAATVNQPVISRIDFPDHRNTDSNDESILIALDVALTLNASTSACFISRLLPQMTLIRTDLDTGTSSPVSNVELHLETNSRKQELSITNGTPAVAVRRIWGRVTFGDGPPEAGVYQLTLDIESDDCDTAAETITDQWSRTFLVAPSRTHWLNELEGEETTLVLSPLHGNINDRGMQLPIHGANQNNSIYNVTSSNLQMVQVKAPSDPDSSPTLKVIQTTDDLVQIHLQGQDSEVSSAQIEFSKAPTLLARIEDKLVKVDPLVGTTRVLYSLPTEIIGLPKKILWDAHSDHVIAVGDTGVMDLGSLTDLENEGTTNPPVQTNTLCPSESTSPTQILDAVLEPDRSSTNSSYLNVLLTREGLTTQCRFRLNDLNLVDSHTGMEIRDYAQQTTTFIDGDIIDDNSAPLLLKTDYDNFSSYFCESPQKLLYDPVQDLFLAINSKCVLSYSLQSTMEVGVFLSINHSGEEILDATFAPWSGSGLILRKSASGAGSTAHPLLVGSAPAILPEPFSMSTDGTTNSFVGVGTIDPISGLPILFFLDPSSAGGTLAQPPNRLGTVHATPSTGLPNDELQTTEAMLALPSHNVLLMVHTNSDQRLGHTLHQLSDLGVIKEFLPWEQSADPVELLFAGPTLHKPLPPTLHGDQIVTLNGAGFAPPSQNRVFVQGIEADVLHTSSASITFRVPTLFNTLDGDLLSWVTVESHGRISGPAPGYSRLTPPPAGTILASSVEAFENPIAFCPPGVLGESCDQDENFDLFSTSAGPYLLSANRTFRIQNGQSLVAEPDTGLHTATLNKDSTLLLGTKTAPFTTPDGSNSGGYYRVVTRLPGVGDEDTGDSYAMITENTQNEDNYEIMAADPTGYLVAVLNTNTQQLHYLSQTTLKPLTSPVAYTPDAGSSLTNVRMSFSTLGSHLVINNNESVLYILSTDNPQSGTTTITAAAVCPSSIGQSETIHFKEVRPAPKTNGFSIPSIKINPVGFAQPLLVSIYWNEAGSLITECHVSAAIFYEEFSTAGGDSALDFTLFYTAPPDQQPDFHLQNMREGHTQPLTVPAFHNDLKQITFSSNQRDVHFHDNNNYYTLELISP